jgi:hypothetical protein
VTERAMTQIAPWGYVPTEPVVLVAQDTVTNIDLERVRFKRLGDALQHFARFHVGPIEGRRACIVDAHNRVVLGYQAPDEDEVTWFGTQLGFDLLEIFYDRASVILWAAGCRGDLNREVKDVVP